MILLITLPGAAVHWIGTLIGMVAHNEMIARGVNVLIPAFTFIAAAILNLRRRDRSLPPCSIP